MDQSRNKNKGVCSSYSRCKNGDCISDPSNIYYYCECFPDFSGKYCDHKIEKVKRDFISRFKSKLY